MDENGAGGNMMKFKMPREKHTEAVKVGKKRSETTASAMF